MINVNKTKESIQNVLIFITDAIALIMSYYMSGFIWLMGIRNNTFPYIMSVLNGNIITIIIAVLIAALFCNIKGDVLNRGKFEELVSVIKKSLISSAVIAVYELLSKTDKAFFEKWDFQRLFYPFQAPVLKCCMQWLV